MRSVRATTWAVLAVLAAGVRVHGQGASRPVYFVRDVAPIFDRESCSSSPCHGKFGGGQGRLQLSLMTLSPEADFAGLEPLIDLQNPANSVLLQKPSGKSPHAGGRRFRENAKEYQTILRWIQEGCRNPTREPLPVRLRVTPERFNFTPDKNQGRIQVTAEFADGSAEDVTDRTRFISPDEEQVEVTPAGYVTMQRWGLTNVVCRYVGLTKAVFISLPRPKTAADPAPPKVAAGNLVDALVHKNLEWLNINPAPRCDDYTFLRRIYLDLVGALPDPATIRAFVKDPDPSKRAKLVDQLLDDPRFVAMRTLRLGDMLRINPRKLANGPLQARAAMIFDDWLRRSVRDNKPFNKLTHELVNARGSTMLNGPANFYRVERSPENRAETIGQAFLGVRLSCARCHNHPFDRWNTDDYWEFAAFLAKIRERGAELFDDRELYVDNKAQLRNQAVTSKKKGQVAVPTFLGGPSLPQEQFQGDYLQALADWITNDDNPYYGKATVNRVWSHFLGRGVVTPVDDIRETSVAAVPALLTLLAQEFRRTGYDTKQLIRLIVTSETYQRSSSSDTTNELDNRFFSHFQPKQMLAQVLLDAINTACGTWDQYASFPRGTTAVELPLMVNNDFLDRFGRSNREFLATLDPHAEPTMPQTLHLINSGYINGKITSREGTVATLEPQLRDDRVLVEELYLRTLCRPPSAGELEQVLGYLKKIPNRREAFEDLLWALISSREFVFIS
ncbi:MAG: DUF1549 domain-containing protein [Fimbriimonadaceae bacterium]|nr:DUF1549 domain-containing protein [Fimbriimonadaceae bacterium]